MLSQSIQSFVKGMMVLWEGRRTATTTDSVDTGIFHEKQWGIDGLVKNAELKISVS
jgi:hypothetical protein